MQKRTGLDTARPLHLGLGLLGVAGRALDGLKEEADVLDNVLDGPVQLRDRCANRASLVALPLLGALQAAHEARHVLRHRPSPLRRHESTRTEQPAELGGDCTEERGGGDERCRLDTSAHNLRAESACSVVSANQRETTYTVHELGTADKVCASTLGLVCLAALGEDADDVLALALRRAGEVDSALRDGCPFRHCRLDDELVRRVRTRDFHRLRACVSPHVLGMTRRP
jgi:hypothetical protein